MYLDFFGLSALPFELTADPRFIYLPPGHQEALSTLQYGVLSRKGLTVLTGEAGLGKTTLLKTALEQLHGIQTRVITISNPALSRPEFIEVIARSLDLTETVGATKPAVLAALESALTRDHDDGTRAVLIADEAHVMPDDLLEEIRLLGNFETAASKLLSIILVGQPELAERLNEPSLRQLKQRVALRCGLTPFSAAETTGYIDTRLRVAGRSAAEVFSPDALEAIHAVTGGIPRIINVVCDNALLSAFAADRRVVNARLIEDVRRDFDLQPKAAEAGSHPVAQPQPAPVPTQTPTSAAAPVTRPGDVGAEHAAPPPAPVRRPHPPAVAPKPPAASAAVADRDSSLFTIYTRRKGFFSRVFSL